MLTNDTADHTIEAICRVHGCKVYRPSVVATPSAMFFLARKGEVKLLSVVAQDAARVARFDGVGTPVTFGGRDSIAKIGPCSPRNAAALRDQLPFLHARPVGLRASAGSGDRLGLATPGHVRAFRRSVLAPVLAQQSMRENLRTGRTPQMVIDDAMWGAFQEGWRHGFGADADHVKTTADIDRCAAVGYTLYTLDPSEHVDNDANRAPVAALRERLTALPWHALDTSWEDTRGRLGTSVDLDGSHLSVTEDQWLRATVKYGRAIAYTTAMARHLAAAMNGRAFELEVSVDESDTVTTLAEHVYIAHELRRLGVHCTSLAPRYVGEFEKGVDYVGDLGEFERSFAGHLAVARTFGPYKLSLHSGSDKFSIFPIAARLAGDLVHLKTSGTSYLEALRAASTLEPDLFREIAVFARDRYPVDRVGYVVSASVDRMPDPGSMAVTDLPALLDNFHAREILHVTFGSLVHDVTLRDRLFETLRQHEEAYYDRLDTHFTRHFAPFGREAPQG